MPPRVGKARAAAATDGVLFDNVVVMDEDVTEEILDIYARLKIDGINLTGEAENHSALFARVAFLAEEASSEALRLKKRLDILKAEKDGEIRRDYAQANEKATEAKVEAAILLDRAVQGLQDEFLATDRAARILGALRQSFAHKRELLVELMRTARHEMRAYGEE